MGGINHQPTRSSLTAASAWLSQQVGRGLIAIHQANNHLEDAIMVGMGKQHIDDLVPMLTGSSHAYIRRAIASLAASLNCVDNIERGYKRLAEAAKKEGYRGNPLAPTIGTLKLGTAFSGSLIRPYINERLWLELEAKIQATNIMTTLAWEAAQFQDLRAPTTNLLVTLDACRRIAETDGDHAMVMAIETGQVPLRQYFAQVFSLWNTLEAMFLYSAVIMTELFYRANAFPSLSDFAPASLDAA